MRLPAPVRNAIESVRSRIVAPVQEELSIERSNAELLRESVTDLERQLHDPGWQQFVAYAQQEFFPFGGGMSALDRAWDDEPWSR